MDPLRNEFISSNISIFKILVNQTVDYNISGILYNEYYQLTMNFHGIREFFGSLDLFFDGVNFPQSSHEHRTFGVKRNKRKEVLTMKKEKLEMETGDKATFTVHVQFRQNASWQGTIQWIEGNKTQRFRSELEMLKLMTNAINFDSESDGLADWEE
ncbi:MAG: hypothetical protein WCI30_06940 [Clostridia bacterium]